MEARFGFLTDDIAYFFRHYKQMYHLACCLMDNYEDDE